MTRALAGLVVETAVLLATGAAFLYGLGLLRRRARHARLAGLAYLAGWALLGTELSFALMLGVPSGVGTVLLLAAATAVVCVVAGRRRTAQPRAWARGTTHPLGRVVAAVAAAIVAGELVAAVVVAVQNVWTTELDLVTAWLPRAETIHYWHSLHPAVWQSYVTPWYPPLVPAMDATAFDFVGGFHPSLLPLQQVVLGAAFVLAALALLDRAAPRWLSLPSLALIVSTPWFWWRLSAILPDQTLAYLLAAAALACALWLHEAERAWLVLAGVLLAAASLTKLEGGLFALLLVAVVVPAGLLRYRRRALPACALLLGPAALVPWRIWLGSHAVATSTPDYNAPHVLSPGFLSARTGRLDYAFHFLLNAPFGWFGSERLTARIVVVSIVVWVLVVRRVPLVAAVAAGWLVLSFLGLLAIYWTSRVEVHFYVTTSAPRVGATIILAAGVLTPLLLGLALRAGRAEPG